VLLVLLEHCWSTADCCKVGTRERLHIVATTH
jgi:hypothetical protein